MKISAFGDLFRLTPETIRFYVNEGLLVPRSVNGRYDFSAQDKEDLSFLLKLKNMQFSLHEIHKILTLRRLSNFDSTDERNDYLKILKEQKTLLLQKRKELDDSIKSVNEEYAEVAMRQSPAQIKSGMPLYFLNLLSCPHCKKELSLANCTIEKQQIMNGSLTCTCGYQAAVKEGIVVGESGPISIYDGMDLERNCYRMMSPELLSLVQKTYLWMTDKLSLCDTDNKIILEDCINNYCFCYTNFINLNPKAYYIISDKFEGVVRMYKDFIEKLGLKLNILYIAAGAHKLPIRQECVDYYIDYDSSNEYAILEGGFALKKVAEYLKPDSSYLGVFSHLAKNSKSKVRLIEEYPEAWQFTFDTDKFQSCLRSEWQDITYINKFGSVTDSGYGESFSYHLKGEELWLSPFFCKYKKEPDI